MPHDEEGIASQVKHITFLIAHWVKEGWLNDGKWEHIPADFRNHIERLIAKALTSHALEARRPLEEEIERLRKVLEKLISVISSINHGKHHEIMVAFDDEPVLPQRKEWIEYLFEEIKKAQEALLPKEPEKP